MAQQGDGGSRSGSGSGTAAVWAKPGLGWSTVAGAGAAGVQQLDAQGKTRAYGHGGSGEDDMKSISLFFLLLL